MTDRFKSCHLDQESPIFRAFFHALIFSLLSAMSVYCQHGCQRLLPASAANSFADWDLSLASCATTGNWMGRGYALSSRERKLQRSQPANRLGYNNKQFALVTCMSPCELSGRRKAVGQAEKISSLIFRPAFGFSLCALRTAGPALLACPEAGDGAPASV